MNGVVHHDNSSRAYLAAFDDGSVNVFREGTTLAQAEANQSEKQGTTVKVVEAVDALVAMVWDGKVVVSESGNSGYYPRTAVGVKEDGTVVLFQADGTMAPRSVGYTAEEEANMLVALGCVAAIQLDEGGSSTYISQREGEADLTMRNTPAGGSERVVSGTILVVSNVAASGEFDHAAITPDDTYYTPDSTVNLEASAMDYSGAAASSLPEDAVFTVSDDSMGTVSDTTVSGSTASAVFTSSGATGDVTVNLVSGGETVGSTVIHIQNPDKLEFNASEVSLNYNEVSNLGFKATYQTESVQLKNGDIDWSISDPDAGSFADNMFAATSNVKYSGSPTVTATRGDLTASVTVNIGMEPTMILDGGDEDPWDYSTIGNTVESFDGMAANAVATYHYSGRGGVVKGSVVSDTDEEYADIVRFGHNAIKLEYDWTNLAATDGACLGLGDNLAVDGTPTAIGVWVYIPEGVPVPWLRAQIATSTNGGSSWTNAYVNFSSGSAGSGEGLKTGWQYLEADLTKYAGAMIRINSGMLFRAMVTTGGIGWYTTDGTKLDKNDLKGNILLDNLCIVYGANNQDVTPPTVNSIQLVNDDGTKTELEDGATLDTANLRFHVTYDDSEETDPYATGVESAYFYFDGTYRGKYDRDNLGSTSGLMHFGNGLHSITFYLKDGYGNVTRETRYFTVNAEQADLPGVTLQATSQPNVGQAWNVGLTSDDLSSITSMTANVSVTRSYPVTDVVFPEGVTGNWNYDSSKGVVTIDISTIDHAVFAADQLASIVVNIPTSVTEGSSLNVQVTKGSYGCKQTENLDISDLNQYASGFTTPVTNYPIEATYRIQADTAVVGGEAFASITYVEDGSAAAGVSVYADDQLLGTTDENGQIDISSLTAAQGNVSLRAADEDGNCSFQIALYSYDAVGDETGAPYNITYNLAQAADGKNISWMANPAHSASKAVVEFSTAEDLSDATQVEGTSRMISYSASNQVNRVNNVTLTGLTAGQTYYYRVGDGSVWSDIQSFTVPAAEKETKFFLLADIQEEAALEGMGRIATQLAGQYHFGIQLGDAVDNVRYYQQWEDALKLFELDGIHDTDILHVIGNHEADDSGNDAIAAKSVFGISAPWYSVERGDVYIAVLNHTSDKDTLQEFAKWLEEDAAKTSCQWKVLVTHVPAYYTNPTGGGETYVQYLPAACDAAGIDFYFSGNDHSYARTAPMASGEVNEDGTVYYICGSTGGKSYSIVDNKAFNFEVATLDFESVYVDVTADRYQMTVTAYNVATDGTRTVLDQYTKRVAPICENDEHTFIYDRTTGELECSICGTTYNAKEELWSGWATDRETGYAVYLTGGTLVTGDMRLDTTEYYFDKDGLSYNGTVEICGESCEFKDGKFVAAKNNSVLSAGFSGLTVEWVLYQDGSLVLGGSGAMKNATTYSTVPWSNYRKMITTVTIGKDITSLGNYAFYKATNLKHVNFAEDGKLTSINKQAFLKCTSLISITVPDTVTVLGSYVFNGCTALNEVVLPAKLKSIGSRMFENCTSLTYVFIPDDMSQIVSSAFNNCPKVVLSVAKGSYGESFAKNAGIAYKVREAAVVESGNCGDGITWALYADGVFRLEGSGAMPAYASKNDVPWFAYRAQIKEVVISKDITSLSKYAFYKEINLERVSIEEGSKLESIGNQAFIGCAKLTEFIMPDTVTTIGTYVFSACTKLEKVVLSEALKTMPTRVFENCTALKEVYIPDGMTSINAYTFVGANNVTLSVAKGSYGESFAKNAGIAYKVREAAVVESGNCGDGITWALYADGVFRLEGSGAMPAYASKNDVPWFAYRAQIKEVVISKDITSLSKYAFYKEINLERVSIEEGSKLESIGNQAFIGCAKLTEFIMPDTVTTIGTYVFSACTKLEKVVLSEALKTMPTRVFENCTALKEVNIPSGMTYINSGTFIGATNVTLSVAKGSYGESYAKKMDIAYTVYDVQTVESTAEPVAVSTENVAPADEAVDEAPAAPETSEAPEAIAEPEVSETPAAAEEETEPETPAAEEEKTEPETPVAEEETNAANTCGEHLTWSVADGVLTISGSGKMDDYSVENPAPWSANAEEITEVVIECDVETIGAYALSGLTKAETVTFAENSALKTIGDYAFAGCTSLKTVRLPEGVTTIGEAAFADCTALETAEIPESVTDIGVRLTETDDQLEPVPVFERCDAEILTVTVVENSSSAVYLQNMGVHIVFEQM